MTRFDRYLKLMVAGALLFMVAYFVRFYCPDTHSFFKAPMGIIGLVICLVGMALCWVESERHRRKKPEKK